MVEIDSDESRLSGLRKELRELKNRQEAIDTQMAEFAGLEKQAADAQKSQGELAAENKSLRDQMRDLEARIKDLEGSSGRDCPLCGQELSEPHKNEILAQYQAEGKQLGDQFRANEKAHQEISLNMEELTSRINDLRKLAEESMAISRTYAGLSAQAESLQARQTQWQQVGALRLVELEQLLSRSSFSAAERGHLTLLEGKIKELGYDETAHARVRQEEIGLRAVEAEYLTLGKARASVTGLRSELDSLEENKNGLEEEGKSQALIVESMRKELLQKEEDLPDLDALRKDLENTRLGENKLRADAGGAEQMVNVLEARRKQKRDLDERIEAANRRVSQLKMLEIAFGKDGVPALLI
jgi:exonuclease SbcC